MTLSLRASLGAAAASIERIRMAADLARPVSVATIVNAYTTSPVAGFTYDSSISQANRLTLRLRHMFALARGRSCPNLTAAEQTAVVQVYQRQINHTTSTDPDANASATVNGSAIAVNFGNLFPDGDREISQTLLHEMMHCAGFRHPVRRDPPVGTPCGPGFDCPGDNGQYYGSPPLRAELCIAGVQSDEAFDATINLPSTRGKPCVIDGEGTASIKAH